ncbi:MAG: phosphoribosyltransferase [Alphaproteobacteria bacterium]|jgi:orotate phosphoribosyltransferase|nr:phosphoribosyltransferase [Alphaproteobacteria bacterium]
MENLFQKHKFKMHSGGISDFKLECDALTTKDYETLAFLVSRKMDFNKVMGIPRGGIPFAEALKSYENPNSKTFLIADDVFTTGGSIIEFKKQLLAENIIDNTTDVKAIVVFSRGELFPFVSSIFALNEDYWQND